MKKTIMMMFAVLTGLSLFADVGYLYWMVDETGDTDKYEFTYAKVRTSSGSYFELYTQESADAQGAEFYNSSYPDDDYTTAAAYAGDFSGISSGSFVFELWLEAELGYSDSLVAWKTVGYKDLASHIYKNKSSGSGSTPYVVAGFVPEPTSAILMLLGFAGLALRRRRSAKSAHTALTAIVAMLAAGSVFAAANNTVLTYEVPVTSTYADGTQVASGESYALVYLPANATGEFAIAADGNEVDVANGRILKVKQANYYKNRCLFEFQLTPNEAKGCSNGSLAVYLLDTRIFGEDGTITYAPINEETLRPTVVNASTKIEDAIVVDVAENRTASFEASENLKALIASAIPEDAGIENPVILAMRIENGKMILTVGNTSPLLAYNATKTDTLVNGTETTHAATSPKTGVEGKTIELEIPIDANSSSGFFKVERN